MARLTIKNDGGTVQFDSSTPAFGFVGSGSIVADDYGGTVDQYNNYSIGYVENLPPFDAYALACYDGGVVAGSTGFNDATALLVSATGGRHTVYYYLFRSYAKLPAVNSGLRFEAKMPNGALAYSTAYRPLTVIAKHPYGSTYYGINEYRALPAGKTYAFLNYGTNQRDMGNGGGGGGGYDVPSVSFNAATCATQISGDGYYLQEVRGNGFAWGPSPNGGLLICDVTGL